MLIPLLASALFLSVPADPTDAAIDRFADNLLTHYNTVGFAVGVIHNGHEYKRYYGSVRKGEHRPPDGKTMFQLASVTKTFTAALLAKAVNEHLVGLNDSVSRYLPGVEMPRSSEPITFEELADHSSGLPRVPKTEGRSSTSYEQMNQELRNTKLKFRPGSGYLYSNYAFGVLAEALANAYHVGNWSEVVERDIIRPLGMTDTLVTARMTQDQKSRIPQGYDKSGAATDWMNPAFPAVNGAGGLYSDLDDMMLYLGYMMHFRQGRDPVLDLMLQPYNPMPKAGMNIGLGWQVNKMADGGWFIEKQGALRGFVSYVCFVKGSDVGLVLLANSRFPCTKPCKQFMANLEKMGELPNSEEEDEG